MPSSSKKQHNFMAAIAHSPSFAKKVGVPQSVGKDFNDADKGKRMKANPMNPKNPPSDAKAIKIPKSSNNRADLQKVNNSKTNQGSAELFKKGGDTMASKMNPGFMAMMAKKKDGKAEGGKADMKQDKSMMQKAVNKHEGRLHKGASMTKLATGGFTKEANGIAKRGLTKGTQVTMKKGGKC
jgi:hypothetical protein